MSDVVTVDPQKCPLCGAPNACQQAVCTGSAESCWCMNPEVKFSPDLLQQVPAQAKGKACICLACAVKSRES